VYSADRRLVFHREKQRDVEIFPTRDLLAALDKRGVKVEDGFDLGGYMRDMEPTRENSKFFKTVFDVFERTLQMRNSCAATCEDYIESPVKNSDRTFFDSRKCGSDMPQNADANGAYHIALKGLWVVNELKSSEYPRLAVSNERWLEFVQKRH
jgi:CRISPR-associated protein Cpf1